MKKEIDVVKQLEQKKYHKNYVPIIVVSIFLLFIIAISTTWALLNAFAPATLGGVAYRFNWNTYALKLYEKDYKDSGDINSLYTALNISIKLNNDDKVIDLYETFSNNSQYSEFIDSVNTANLKQSVNAVIKASLLNEDNYLKNQYIQSLIDKAEDDKAFQFAIKDNLNMHPVYNNIGNYLYNNFCKSGVIDRFYNNFRNDVFGTGNMLVVDMFNYMKKVNETFLNGFNSQIDSVYLWSMGNRVLQVGANVIVVCDKLGIEETDGLKLVEDTTYIMDNINQKFKLMTTE